MKYGFWEDLEELLEEYPEADWWFLDGVFSTHGLNPFNFLHGCCDVFSQYLHDTYGYQIVGLYEDQQLIHAYCTEVIDGVSYFIDIRGITDDWEEFIKEFYEAGLWSGDYDNSYYLKGNDVNSSEDAQTMKDEEPYRAAQAMDVEYGFYNLKSYTL